MTRHGRHGALIATLLVLGMVTMTLVPLATKGASQFATPAFEQQWNGVESVTPNFWGPLATAREGQTEPYAEGIYNGQRAIRLVQYFDKARMEQTTPDRPVTNGLLIVELKSGQVQFGDVSFQPRTPAAIGIAGDQDVPGPTYATLNDPSLPERVAPQSGAVDRGYDVPSKTFVTVPPATDPQLAFVTYQGDPGGRFGQNIPKAFWDFMQAIPGPGWLATMGYPITQAFGTQVQVNGVPNTFVVVQAFERRVLTYTPSNPDAFKVEFGNIGRHYDTWHYPQSPPPGLTPPPPPTPAMNVLSGSFGALYNTNERVRGLLGPPESPQYQGQGGVLEFEHGRMVHFRDDTGRGAFYILCGGPDGGEALIGLHSSFVYPDPWDPSKPVGGGPGPSPGLYEPPRGYGTIWNQIGRSCLGYATAPDETPSPVTDQTFQRGSMISTPDGQGVWVLWMENRPTGGGQVGRYERFALPAP